MRYDIKNHPLTINKNLFKQININQMFDKIQMILMMKSSISNNRILRLKNLEESLIKKHSKFQNFNEIFILLWHDQTQEHEFGCFYTMSAHKNHFKKQKYGTESV